MRACSVQFRRELVPTVISNKVLVSSVNKPLMPRLVDQINSCSFCHEHYTCTETIWAVHLRKTTQNRCQERGTRWRKEHKDWQQRQLDYYKFLSRFTCDIQQEITQMLQRNCTLIITFTREHLQAHPSSMASSSRPQTTVGTLDQRTLVTCTVHYYNCSLHSCRWGLVFTVGRKARQLGKDSSRAMYAASVSVVSAPTNPSAQHMVQRFNRKAVKWVVIITSQSQITAAQKYWSLRHSKRMLPINCPDHLLFIGIRKNLCSLPGQEDYTPVSLHKGHA